MTDISVIVPVHNGTRWVQDTLTSILAQTIEPCEVIAVDDGSTDGSAALIASRFPDIRVIEQVNRGEQAARNRGMSLARGEVVAFVDQDDLWRPDHLEVTTAALTHPETSAVAPTSTPIDPSTTYATFVDAVGYRSDRARDEDRPLTSEQLWRGGVGGGNCIVAERDFLQSLGGFPTISPGIGDYLLLVILASTGRLAQTTGATYGYRTHAEMASYRYNMCERTINAKLLMQASGLIQADDRTWDSYLVRGFITDSPKFGPREVLDALSYSILLRVRPRIVAGGVFRRFRPRG